MGRGILLALILPEFRSTSMFREGWIRLTFRFWLIPWKENWSLVGLTDVNLVEIFGSILPQPRLMDNSKISVGFVGILHVMAGNFELVE